MRNQLLKGLKKYLSKAFCKTLKTFNTERKFSYIGLT